MKDQRPMALVTGASYGVGAATAMALAHRGYNVAVTATSTNNLSDTIKALESTDAQSIALELDLVDTNSIRNMYHEVIAAFGGLDLLVNNAATTGRMAATEVTSEDWAKVIGTNLQGTYFTTIEFGKYLMEQQRAGSVVSVVSIHGLHGASNQSLYGISKGGVVQMTRMLAVEWAEANIRVNAVAPGRLDTPSPLRRATASDPDYMKTIVERIPLHRLTTADEVANAVCFLGSQEANTITGQILSIDGGLSA